MKTSTLKTSDGATIKYGVAQDGDRRPWLILIMPFGLELTLSEPFIDFFSPQYNVVTWESRYILDSTDECQDAQALCVANHAADVLAVMDECGIRRGTLVGYCSGAGIALEAVNRAPDRFDKLFLVHGEYTMLDVRECTTQFAGDIDSLLSLAASDRKRGEKVFEKIRDERLSGGADIPDGIDNPFSDLRYFRRYANNYTAYKSVDYRALASAVRHETYVLTGGRDIQANVASAEAIRALIPGAQIFVDEQADHYGMVRPESATMVTIWNCLARSLARSA